MLIYEQKRVQPNEVVRDMEEVDDVKKERRENTDGRELRIDRLGIVSGAILAPFLLVGCIGAISLIAINTEASASQETAHVSEALQPEESEQPSDTDGSATETVPEENPSASTPGSNDPITPPDRDSDQEPEVRNEDFVYVIQSGDTLTTLSERFGMSVDHLALFNDVIDTNVISEGAALRVPASYAPLSGVTE